MADGIDFKMFLDPAKELIRVRQRDMPRAAMWAVREAGRVTRREAARNAPVLKSKTLLTHRQLQRARRAGFDVGGYYTSGTDAQGRTSTAGTGPIPGLLKASIRSSRRLQYHGTSDYSIKVGPRGARVHLYAEKAENKHHYMEAGEHAGRAALPAIAEKAFARVWKD